MIDEVKINPRHIVTGVHDSNSIAWLWEMEETPLCQNAADNKEVLDDDCFSDQQQILYGDFSEKIGHFDPVPGSGFTASTAPDPTQSRCRGATT